jgi:hypothetical protein
VDRAVRVAIRDARDVAHLARVARVERAHEVAEGVLALAGDRVIDLRVLQDLLRQGARVRAAHDHRASQVLRDLGHLPRLGIEDRHRGDADDVGLELADVLLVALGIDVTDEAVDDRDLVSVLPAEGGQIAESQRGGLGVGLGIPGVGVREEDPGHVATLL